VPSYCSKSLDTGGFVGWCVYQLLDNFFLFFSFSPPKSHQGDKTCPSRHGGRQGDETVRFDAVHDDFDEFYLYGGCGRVAQVI
jgi:hypothetical protein